jgi:hypothetical protein
MLAAHSSHTRQPLGPHSRVLRRGVLGDAIDGRSKEGRFLRHCEAGLLAQLGGEPSFAQRLLIRRVSRAVLRLDFLDEKMASGTLTDHDAKAFSALSNTVRLCLRELGIKATPTKRANPLAEHFSRPPTPRGAS